MSGFRSADGFGGPLATLLAEVASGAALPAQQQSLAVRACALLDTLATAAPEWPEGMPFEWLAIVDDEQVTVLQPSGPRVLASRRGGRYTALRLMPETGPQWQLHFLEAALAPSALAEAGFAARPVDEEPTPEVCVSVTDGATLVSAHRILPGGEAVDEQDSRSRIDRRFGEAAKIVRRLAREAEAGETGLPETGVAGPGTVTEREAGEAGRDWGRIAARAGAVAAVAGAAAVAAAAAARTGHREAGWALVRSGEETGPPLLVAGTLRVGRSPQCELPLDDPLVSREHAAFEVVDGECVVRDLRSTHGTRVNGRKIEAPTRLRDGDRVTIGAAELVVRGTSPDTAATFVGPAVRVGADQGAPAAATAAAWHFAVGGRSQGPVAEPELRARLAQGALPPDSLVWRPGLEKWVSAREAGLLAAEKPEDALCPGCARPVEPDWTFCSRCGSSLTG